MLCVCFQSGVVWGFCLCAEFLVVGFLLVISLIGYWLLLAGPLFSDLR